jgi:hypothetical protein
MTLWEQPVIRIYCSSCEREGYVKPEELVTLSDGEELVTHHSIYDCRSDSVISQIEDKGWKFIEGNEENAPKLICPHCQK